MKQQPAPVDTLAVSWAGAAPGADPGADPGAAPGADPGAAPGADPGSSPGADPKAAPGAAPGADPGAALGADPGAAPGAAPGDAPGAAPRAAPDASPGAAPGADPGADPGVAGCYVRCYTDSAPRTQDQPSAQTERAVMGPFWALDLPLELLSHGYQPHRADSSHICKNTYGAFVTHVRY